MTRISNKSDHNRRFKKVFALSSAVFFDSDSGTLFFTHWIVSPNSLTRSCDLVKLLLVTQVICFHKH